MTKKTSQVMVRSIDEPWEVSQDKLHPMDAICLRMADYPLYHYGQKKFVARKGDQILMNWDSHLDLIGRRLSSSNYFDAQISTDIYSKLRTFYILGIHLELHNRGKGLGFQLYQILEQIAKDLECQRIQMTASGWTRPDHKETRKSYLCRKLGYKPLLTRLSYGLDFREIQPTETIEVFKDL